MDFHDSWHLLKPQIRAWSRREKLKRPWAGLRGPRRTSGRRVILLSRHWPHLLCWSWTIEWDPMRANFGTRLCLRFGPCKVAKTFDLGPFVVRWQDYDWMVAVGPHWRERAKRFVVDGPVY